MQRVNGNKATTGPHFTTLSMDCGGWTQLFCEILWRCLDDDDDDGRPIHKLFLPIWTS